MVMALYLLGIFMGAIDTGIVTPARTLIQGALGVDGKSGIWIITIYTLAYAAIIPVSGKLADRYGRRLVYIVSILLFGLGSAMCAFSGSTGSFAVMLVGRVVQALGGGGIMPIATAEFGTTFPPERRGMALGLVGGVYGIANILGSSAGSVILDTFGKDRWDLLFLVNVPVALFIVVAGLLVLPNTKAESTKRIDAAGIPVMVAMVLALLYGLRNIDFFDFAVSLGSSSVWPFLVAFAVLAPVFILIERKAEDPVLRLDYFRSRGSLITLLLAFVVGVMMMGMVFVPQFAENALGIASGSGGYFVAILGLFAGLSGPASGSLVDRIGPKKVLYAGFFITLGGALFLVFYTLPHPGVVAVMASLAVMGLGLGFTMGTPLNYMMLQNAREGETTSALATLSLVRSIGTAIAPAIMIGFLAHAGQTLPERLMPLMPPVKTPVFASAGRLNRIVEELKADPRTAAMAESMRMPAMGSAAASGGFMSMAAGTDSGSGDAPGSAGMPPELLAKLQAADVTTIVGLMKETAVTMFDSNVPGVVESIIKGLDSGLEGMKKAESSMKQNSAGLSGGMAGIAEAVSRMDAGIAGIDAAIAGARAPAMAEALKVKRAELVAARTPLAAKLDGMKQAEKGIGAGLFKIRDAISAMEAFKAEVPAGFAAARTEYLAAIEANRASIEAEFRGTLNSGFAGMFSTVAVASIAGGALLSMYRKKEKEGKEMHA